MNSEPSKQAFMLIACLLLLIQAEMLLWSATLHSPASDEPVHLAAGLRHLQDGRFDMNLGNPPLIGMISAIPVIFMDPIRDGNTAISIRDIRRQFVNPNRSRIFDFIIVGRWALIPFTILGGVVCFHWASEIYGKTSGLFALSLWCFSPNILAHGQLISGDMAAISLGTTVLYTFWKWLNKPNRQQAFLVGIVLGFAELAKYVWVILYPLMVFMWAASRITGERDNRSCGLIRDCKQLSFIFLLSVYVINCGYAFERTFQPLSTFIYSEPFGGGREDASSESERDLKGVIPEFLSNVPVPLPENYIKGGLRIAEYYEETQRESYLLGEWKQGGWWYYYFYGLFIKVPIGVWMVLAASFCAAVSTIRYSRDVYIEWYLSVPIIVVISFVTAVTSIQHHVRYVMPVLPLIFIQASKIAKAFEFQDRLFAVIAVSGLAWTILSSLLVFPHSLSYFNEWAGGPERGHESLLDTNIDTGQDLFFLKRWHEQNPEASPLAVETVGMINPEFVGFESTPAVPVISANPDRRFSESADRQGPMPGWYAMSVHKIHWPKFKYFLHIKPKARAGYSIYIYHIDCVEANRVRRIYGIPELNCNTLIDSEDIEVTLEPDC